MNLRINGIAVYFFFDFFDHFKSVKRYDRYTGIYGEELRIP